MGDVLLLKLQPVGNHVNEQESNFIALLMKSFVYILKFKIVLLKLFEVNITLKQYESLCF